MTIYLELPEHQRTLILTDRRFGFRRTYGTDAEKIAGINIKVANLPP
jgi:hypothetical protein